MRRVVALAVGLVVSTLLLGGGWLRSTWREHETRLREASARVMSVADRVHGAIDESLEELRAREDERPFYLYSHFYSPPDVLALSDPVAVSPLARPPTDPRIIGHFQLDPGGMVRTPYTADPSAEPHPLSARVREIVAGDAFAVLRALTGDAVLLGASPPPAPPDNSDNSFLSLSVGDSQPLYASASDPRGDFNVWGNTQANDINLAQRGDSRANERVMNRGRQVPILRRRDVSWDEAQAQQAQQAHRQQRSPSLPRRPSARAVRRQLETRRDAVLACAPGREVTVRLRIRGEDGRPMGITTGDSGDRHCVREALEPVRFSPFLAETLVIGYRFAPSTPTEPELSDPSRLGNMAQRESEVEYTPMVFRELGEHVVLYRLVTHEGVSAVQGVIIDRARLATEWIPELVARHTPGDLAPTVVQAGEGECEMRREASAIVPDIELCFAASALTAASAGLDEELGWQVAALALLLSIALLAAFAIVSAARRAEALSRQKSAFVSAVSHELRTPLTTVRMHAEMLEEGLVSEERRPKVYRELVRESVRLAKLVDNVLSLSKLEEGRRPLNRSEGDLRGHVREVVEGQRRFVEERGFELNGPEIGGAVEVVFDRQAIEQIVVNLIDNAVKYGEGEEKVIDVRVEPPGTIVVADRGPGIPASERARVFERFYRVEREEHAHAPGTGIGLALVAELAAAHGGRASVAVREGGGLEVHVRIG